MIDNHLISTLSDMIAIPSVNPMGQDHVGEIYSEKNLADYVAQKLKKLGFGVEMIYKDATHPNVVGYMDIGAKETLLLDSHLDTVSHLEMIIDPFDPVRKEGRLFGRGSCDTKSTMAIFLTALEILNRKGVKPTRNIMVVGCSDEEFSFSGVRQLAQKGLKADMAIVGEPTELDILHAHKGVYRTYVRAKGRSCHSSLPEEGINAIYLLSEAALRLKALHEDIQRRDPHPLLGKGTLSVGLVGGGQTVNTVPSAAWLELDRRVLPNESTESVHQEIANAIQDIDGVEVDPPHVETGGFENEVESNLIQSFLGTCKHHHHHPQFTTAPFCTHGSIFQPMGIPSLVFGPGSIKQAHTENEYVPEDELQKALDIVLSFLTRESN